MHVLLIRVAKPETVKHVFYTRFWTKAFARLARALHLCNGQPVLVLEGHCFCDQAVAKPCCRRQGMSAPHSC